MKKSIITITVEDGDMACDEFNRYIEHNINLLDIDVIDRHQFKTAVMRLLSYISPMPDSIKIDVKLENN